LRLIFSELAPSLPPNGRAKFADRDFGRELPITFRKLVFSATAGMRKTPLARVI
jgi:hypothetical protein